MNDPNAHDRVQVDIEINYKLESWEDLADLGSTALENALFNENIDIEGWTFVSINVDPNANGEYLSMQLAGGEDG